MQAHEALRLLMGLPVEAGELRLLDAKRLQTDRVTIARDPTCRVCSG
jgi:MoeZ/MoeB domain.